MHWTCPAVLKRIGKMTCFIVILVNKLITTTTILMYKYIKYASKHFFFFKVCERLGLIFHTDLNNLPFHRYKRIE